MLQSTSSALSKNVLKAVRVAAQIVENLYLYLTEVILKS